MKLEGQCVGMNGATRYLVVALNRGKQGVKRGEDERD